MDKVVINRPVPFSYLPEFIIFKIDIMNFHNTIVTRFKFSYCLLVIIVFGSTLQGKSQICFDCNFTEKANLVSEIEYPFHVYNRISPINGFNIPLDSDAKLCIVRPLGGKYKNGGPDLSMDTYLWNEEKGEFYTDFSLLKQQIDGVLNRGFKVHQIVLDNPSWAFQRDTIGKLNGDSLIVSTYGNAEPPRNNNAWSSYLKKVMQFLIETYGEEEISKIHFGIGREIGTKGHWSGTKAEFFTFYQHSVNAIQEILPGAKVGSHFLWQSSKNAWAIDFIKWCKDHQVHYDKIGVSYYPFFDKAERTDFDKVYKKDFGAIKDHTDWNPNAELEIHEFSLIETMSKKGNSYKSASAKYQNSFLIGMAKMLFQHDIQNLFLWGNGAQYATASAEIIKLNGSTYWNSNKEGCATSVNNYVDAIYTKNEKSDNYTILAYNYSSNPRSKIEEQVRCSSTIPYPPNTKIKYRFAIYNTETNSMDYTKWSYDLTNGDKKEVSSFSIEYLLPAFSFLKMEFMINYNENVID